MAAAAASVIAATHDLAEKLYVQCSGKYNCVRQIKL